MACGFTPESIIFERMPNSCTINFNDLHLEITSRVRKPTWVKAAMVAANLAGYGVVLGAYQMVASDSNALVLIIPFLALMIFQFLTLTRYTLWLVYGTETLIISTRAIECHHDYGWFALRPKKARFRQLSAIITPTNSKGAEVNGRLSFYDHNELGQSEAVLTTAIDLPRTQLETIVRKLNLLFFLRDNQPSDNLKVLLN